MCMIHVYTVIYTAEYNKYCIYISTLNNCYWLLQLCSLASSASTSAQRRHRQRMNQAAFNSFKLGDDLRCIHCALKPFLSFLNRIGS